MFSISCFVSLFFSFATFAAVGCHLHCNCRRSRTNITDFDETKYYVRDQGHLQQAIQQSMLHILLFCSVIKSDSVAAVAINFRNNIEIETVICTMTVSVYIMAIVVVIIQVKAISISSFDDQH